MGNQAVPIINRILVDRVATQPPHTSQCGAQILGKRAVQFHDDETRQVSDVLRTDFFSECGTLLHARRLQIPDCGDYHA